MRRLAVTVHVEDPETGRHVVFLRGATPPERLSQFITNPDVWEGEEAEPVEVPEVHAPVEPKAPVGPEPSDGGEPPRSGKGSSRDAWVAFAGQHGVDVEDDDTRDDIVAKLIAAGTINE
jgi:hypothetical protein